MSLSNHSWKKVVPGVSHPAVQRTNPAALQLSLAAPVLLLLWRTYCEAAEQDEDDCHQLQLKMVESESVVLLDDRLPGEATSKYYIILISDSFHDHDLLNVL